MLVVPLSGAWWWCVCGANLAGGKPFSQPHEVVLSTSASCSLSVVGREFHSKLEMAFMIYTNFSWLSPDKKLYAVFCLAIVLSKHTTHYAPKVTGGALNDLLTGGAHQYPWCLRLPTSFCAFESGLFRRTTATHSSQLTQLTTALLDAHVSKWHRRTSFHTASSCGRAGRPRLRWIRSDTMQTSLSVSGRRSKLQGMAR